MIVEKNTRERKYISIKKPIFPSVSKQNPLLWQICFWLVENGFRVLIAACDTFRAGAVEQLRTHERKLNTLHPADLHAGLDMVKVFEKGYGKDPAGIAMEAINFGQLKFTQNSIQTIYTIIIRVLE